MASLSRGALPDITLHRPALKFFPKIWKVRARTVLPEALSVQLAYGFRVLLSPGLPHQTLMQRADSTSPGGRD
jgi:hypothetical protein